MSTPTLSELARESRMGAPGTLTTDREVRRVSLADLDARRAEVTEQLWSAATDIGFFQLVDHGITPAEVDAAFAAAAAFFALPAEVKARYPMRKGLNAGYEHKSQVRPRSAPRTRRSPGSSPARTWPGCGPPRTRWPASATRCWPSRPTATRWR